MSKLSANCHRNLISVSVSEVINKKMKRTYPKTYLGGSAPFDSKRPIESTMKKGLLLFSQIKRSRSMEQNRSLF